MKNLETNLEKVIEEMNTAMKNVREIVDEPEYRGMVRNHSVEVMTSYLNNLQNKYIFQTGYTISYSTIPTKRRIGYEDIGEIEE